MNNRGTERAKKAIIGSFSTIPGVTMVFEEGEAGDYLQMRTAQLSALSEVINCEGFAVWDQHIQSNVRWIVSTLAAEVESVVPIALQEARSKARMAEAIKPKQDRSPRIKRRKTFSLWRVGRNGVVKARLARFGRALTLGW